MSINVGPTGDDVTGIERPEEEELKEVLISMTEAWAKLSSPFIAITQFITQQDRARRDRGHDHQKHKGRTVLDALGVFILRYL
jgi:hypothetical protein